LARIIHEFDLRESKESRVKLYLLYRDPRLTRLSRKSGPPEG